MGRYWFTKEEKKQEEELSETREENEDEGEKGWIGGTSKMKKEDTRRSAFPEKRN